MPGHGQHTQVFENGVTRQTTSTTRPALGAHAPCPRNHVCVSRHQPLRDSLLVRLFNGLVLSAGVLLPPPEETEAPASRDSCLYYSNVYLTVLSSFPSGVRLPRARGGCRFLSGGARAESSGRGDRAQGGVTRSCREHEHVSRVLRGGAGGGVG